MHLHIRIQSVSSRPPEYRPPRNKFNIIITVTDFPFLTSFPNWRNPGEKNVHNYAAALNATLV